MLSKETRAFSPQSYQGQLYLFVNKKERESVTRELVEKLKKMKTSSGQRLFRCVKIKNEVYSGPYVINAPDILLVPRSGYRVRGKIISTRGEIVQISNSGLERIDRYEADHEIEGIFIAKGKEIAINKCKIDRANVLDIAPTILYYFGISIPPEMDGNVIPIIVHSARMKNSSMAIQNSRENIDQACNENYREKEEMKERLRKLGYL